MKRYFCYFLLLSFALEAHSANETTLNTDHSNETPLSVTSPAQRWGLTTEEWTRYEQLKLGERGIWSPSLDPLTTLGVEATTDGERHRYAGLLVEKEAQRVEKELAFQRAYDDAWQQRFPGLAPVSTSAGNSVTNRLAVFVREDCPSCHQRIKVLLSSGHPLDIYLVDSRGDDNRLRRLARTWQVDPERVQHRDITLNHDGGRWLQYGGGRMPAVLEKQGDAWLPVTTP
ncbi:TIGR03759 family integrating conjugative element protein [Salmonella enterica subsp. diarizonae]|nr:TIGR03759 family integrating conjugative element protein [Salmonella enterica subsp. diarizonae]EJZ7021721.1 TIGR03759 family integrating conjugative element protein [Salmonella enterica]HAF2305817.1 TIGR03759 family integrating conjugative element protein [Salmonella enterica]